MQRDSPETLALLDRVRAGDSEALDRLMARHRPLLRRFVERRLDPQLQARLDASDVVQEAHLEIARRIGEYLERRPMPFRLWVHRTAYENLLRLRRAHLQADRRAIAREMPLPEASSALLVRRLLDEKGNWPGRRLVENEIRLRVQEALGELEEMDREVLQLRSFERLENDEVAQVLGVAPAAASKRYGRALLRLRKVLTKNDDQPS